MVASAVGQAGGKLQVWGSETAVEDRLCQGEQDMRFLSFFVALCWLSVTNSLDSLSFAVMLCCDRCRSKEALKAWAYKQVPDTFPELWGWVIFVLISMFAVSCINTLAQSYKVWLDEQEAAAEQRRAKQQ